jgi:hypothetical protein
MLKRTERETLGLPAIRLGASRKNGGFPPFLREWQKTYVKKLSFF